VLWKILLVKGVISSTPRTVCSLSAGACAAGGDSGTGPGFSWAGRSDALRSEITKMAVRNFAMRID
jgi:hypothetical protein